MYIVCGWENRLCFVHGTYVTHYTLLHMNLGDVIFVHTFIFTQEITHMHLYMLQGGRPD
jgi:hypothetical protein